MTNLRDELWTMLEPHFAIMGVAFPEKPIDRNAHIEKWAQFIGRAIAAERAATIEECKRAAQTAPTFSNDLIGRGKSYAVKRIDELSHDRSALDDTERVSERRAYDRIARHLRGQEKIEGTSRSETNFLSALDEVLIKAEEKGWSKAVSETIQHFSTGPQSGCGCAYCDPRTRYGDALAQARREQREKDEKAIEPLLVSAKTEYDKNHLDEPWMSGNYDDATESGEASGYMWGVEAALKVLRAQED